MKPVLIGAVLGALVGAVLVVVPTLISGDSYEINDSLIGTVPLGLAIGAVIGLVVGVARRRSNKP